MNICKLNKVYLLVLFIMLGCLSVEAQVSFYDATSEVLGEEAIHSTVGIAIDDLNGDRKDDLILLDEGIVLKTFIQKGKKQNFDYKVHTQTSTNGDLAIITGDLNNDGTPEVICSGFENGSEVLFYQNGLYITKQLTENVYSQNTNLVDLDNDGDLDFFVCNDVGKNRTYFNDGNGTFSYSEIIDFQTSEEDDMSGNYSSIFFDIDMDGDQDLYIGKCRAGVTDPTDRRRVNTLYINQGDGTYLEKASDYGLAIGAQTWSVDAGDVDNDGDLDLIVANHDLTHDLMINDGQGHFSRFYSIPEEIKSFAYQSFFADFDNNGWLDIFITEPSKSYILYNEAMSFSIREIRHQGKAPFSGVTGDLNSDGFLDLYLGFGSSFQSPGTKKDAIYFNETNTNNFINFTLEGTISNRDAVGSKVFLYTELGVQYQEVIVGKSYGIMNTTSVHFGLGHVEAVDSVRVIWPSGLEEVLYDFSDVNSHYTITEDGCLTSRLELPDMQLCAGQPIEIELEESYDEYLWSDGTSMNTLSINEPGHYYVEVVQEGCKIESNTFEVKEEFSYNAEELIFSQSLVGCNNDIIELEAANGVSYLWNTGDQTRTIEISSPGTYHVTVSTNCDTYESDGMEVEYLYQDDEEVMTDSVLIGESATVSLTGENVSWYEFVNDLNSINEGNTFITAPLFSDTVFFAGERTQGNLFTDNLLQNIPLNNSSDNDKIENDSIRFSVLQSLYIHNIHVRTQIAGIRSIEIWKDENLVSSISHNCEVGVNKIVLDLDLNRGDYIITTNEDQNMESLGVPYPRFSFSQLYNDNDRRIHHYITINESQFYSGFTSYFFNWEIDYGLYDCETRYEVGAFVKDDVSTIDISSEVAVYPNPANHHIIISLPYDEYDLTMYDMNGETLYTKGGLSYDSYHTINLPSGLYLLEVRTESGVGYQKVQIVRD